VDAIGETLRGGSNWDGAKSDRSQPARRSAEVADFAPGNVRAQAGGDVAELGRCLTDDHQGVFDGEGDLIVCGEGCCVQVSGELLDAIDIIDNIGEPLKGLLEGTHDLAIHALTYARLERSFLDQIGGLPEQVGNPIFDP
jgi:hypothetical protein